VDDRSGEVWVGVASSCIAGIIYRRMLWEDVLKLKVTCVCVRAPTYLHIPVIALFCLPPEGKTKNIFYPTALQ
jgi:hypothetical protein